MSVAAFARYAGLCACRALTAAAVHYVLHNPNQALSQRVSCACLTSAGSLGSRRWSSLAKWRLREFNELPHYIQHRLDASYEAAVKYVGQFPSPMVSQVRVLLDFSTP
jgi:hypothetical protein